MLYKCKAADIHYVIQLSENSVWNIENLPHGSCIHITPVG